MVHDCFGRFLCVQANIDITKPLSRVLFVRFFTNEEDSIMMPSLYECLPEFCYYYGRISHAYTETEIMPKDEKV